MEHKRALCASFQDDNEEGFDDFAEAPLFLAEHIPSPSSESPLVSCAHTKPRVFFERAVESVTLVDFNYPVVPF